MNDNTEWDFLVISRLVSTVHLCFSHSQVDREKMFEDVNNKTDFLVGIGISITMIKVSWMGAKVDISYYMLIFLPS